QPAARRRMITSALRWLVASQNADGGWGGAARVASSIEETALALDALGVLAGRGEETAELRAAILRGADWLLNATGNGSVLAPSPIGFYFARLWYFEELYPLIFATAALARPFISDPRASH
ncbi:MAG: squalene--hopene cyclase, partial [Acidobacteria bacterium]|nr:squalene--hopene cyclase [Acidobacteriota bacterium]